MTATEITIRFNRAQVNGRNLYAVEAPNALRVLRIEAHRLAT